MPATAKKGPTAKREPSVDAAMLKATQEQSIAAAMLEQCALVRDLLELLSEAEREVGRLEERLRAAGSK